MTTEETPNNTTETTESKPEVVTTDTPKELPQEPTKDTPKESEKGKLTVDEFGQVLNSFAEIFGKQSTPSQPTPEAPKEAPQSVPQEKEKEEAPQVTVDNTPKIDPQKAVESLVAIYKVPPELQPIVKLLDPVKAAEYLNSDEYLKALTNLETKANTEKRGTKPPKTSEVKNKPKRTFQSLNSQEVSDAFKDCFR